MGMRGLSLRRLEFKWRRSHVAEEVAACFFGAAAQACTSLEE